MTQVIKTNEFPLRLTVDTYLKAFAAYPSHKGITGGTIHDFLRDSKVVYYGGRCPVYYVEHYHNGKRAVIGGKYASCGKPVLTAGAALDFD